MSYVHDYIHRPEELDDVSLYTWISAYKRGRLPTKTKTKTAWVSSLDREALEDTDHEEDEDCDVAQDHPTDDDSDGHEGRPEILDEDTTANSKGMLHFMADHPLFSTHGVRCLPSPLVPNFGGWMLPRHDQSDREFYCTTMLTLFKPWQTGNTLKTKDASWDEAFTAHMFTDQQEQIMRNFNIQYECLNQRDDFMSELNKGPKGPTVPGLIINDDLAANDMNQTDIFDEIPVDDVTPDNIDIDDQQSRRYQQQL